MRLLSLGRFCCETFTEEAFQEQARYWIYNEAQH